MIIAGDCETLKKNDKGTWEYVLDATGNHVKVACFVDENGVEKCFRDKFMAWNYILKKGESEAKRGKRAIFYFHNAKYDFYNLANLNDKNIKWFSESPFIAGYYKDIEKTFNDEEYSNWKIFAQKMGQRYRLVAEGLGFHTISYKKEIIRFLDTMSIYSMSLEAMGKMIGHEKEKMPEEKFGGVLTEEQLKKLEKYCINDCKVVMEGIKKIRNKLREEKVNIKNLCTKSQIAISYIMNKIKNAGGNEGLIKYINNKPSEYIIKSRCPKDIHKAYRAGLVRVWKTGEFNNLTDIDCNSLFPYACKIMRLPDLRTERKVWQPLQIYEIDILLSKMGISKCMVQNKSNKLGLIPVRTGGRSYVPLEGKYIIGTWTNKELKKAIEEGYEIKAIEWSILYEDWENILGKIYEDVYKRRKEGGDEFNNYFYKCILNSSIGKFGQERTNQEIFIDSVEMVNEYINQNMKVLKGIEGTTNLMYSNQINNYIKKYYNPIIPALITAEARIFMYDQYKKVPLDRLVYTDTDSIIMEGDFRSRYNMGEELGQFKTEKDINTGEELVNAKGIIWGTKSKAIGNNIGVSGVFKKELNLEDFRRGEVKSRKINSIKCGVGKEVGSFEETTRDLKKQKEDLEELEFMLKKQSIYVDEAEEDISYFTLDIEKAMGTCITPI